MSKETKMLDGHYIFDNTARTCPECTSPHPLPQGLERCVDCEEQDYLYRHISY